MVNTSANKPIEVQKPSLVDLYSVSDPIPAPEVVESDSDAAWALWDESLILNNRKWESFLKTSVPAEPQALFLFSNLPKRCA